MSAGLAVQIVDALGDGVFALDRDGRVMSWNPRIAALTGVPAERIIGQPVFDVVPSWRLAAHRHIGRALDGTSSVASSFPIAAAGRFEATFAPLGDGVLAIVRDVSRSELTRQQLQESDERFHIMADSSPVLLWMSGTDGLCTFFNQPWLAFTGRTLAQELGSGWAENVHPEDFQRCMDVYLAAFAARQSFRMEYRLRRYDGQYRWLLDTGVPRYLPSGTFVGFVGSCVDVTDFKHVRDDLDRRVRERTADLEAFAYSVSHDLRTPLRSIDGFSQALLEDYASMLDATGQDYLRRVRDAAQRMGALIDDMLELSRVGRVELRATRCDLARIARAVVAVLREQEPGRAIEISIQDGQVVHADERLLRVALDNLIGNAWKFTSKTEHPRIEVTATEHDGERVYAVADNGAGFDPAFTRKLFGAFQRLHHLDEFPGTGIGLATVHRIISRHGGKVWAEGAVGRGATFYFTLPEEPIEHA